MEGLGDVPVATLAHLAEGDLEGGGGAGGEGVEGGAGPGAEVGGVGGGVTRGFGFEGGDDRGNAFEAEDPVDGFAELAAEEGGAAGGEPGVEFLDRGGDVVEAVAEGHVVWDFEFGEAGGEGRERGGVDVVGGDSGEEGVGALEAGGGEGEVGAGGAVEAGEEEGAADVGEETDSCFGHGEDGAFRGDADGCVHGEADASAHRDAVHVGNVGLGVGGDEVIELVFEAEVGLGGSAAGGTGGVVEGEGCNVAAGAEGFGARAADDDDGSHLGLLPFLCDQ